MRRFKCTDTKELQNNNKKKYEWNRIAIFSHVYCLLWSYELHLHMFVFCFARVVDVDMCICCNVLKYDEYNYISNQTQLSRRALPIKIYASNYRWKKKILWRCSRIEYLKRDDWKSKCRSHNSRWTRAWMNEEWKHITFSLYAICYVHFSPTEHYYLVSGVNCFSIKYSCFLFRSSFLSMNRHIELHDKKKTYIDHRSSPSAWENLAYHLNANIESITDTTY